MHKYLLVILAITQMSKCEHKTSSSDVPVKVFRATSQSWVGGAIGMGKGTNYRFFLPMADTIYEFDSVWVAGYRISVEKTFDPSSPDTLILEARLFFPGKGIPANDAPQPSPPVAVISAYPDCDAYFRFMNKDKSFGGEYCIPKIEVLPRMLYE